MWKLISVMLVAALLTSACGGGGDSSDPADPPGSSNPPSGSSPQDPPGQPPTQNPPPSGENPPPPSGEQPPGDPPNDPAPGDPPPDDPPPDDAQDPTDPLEAVSIPWRTWRFAGRNGLGREETLQLDSQGPGELTKYQDFGRLALIISGRDDRASGEVYANDTGSTYWVDTEAPIGIVTIATDRIGSSSSFSQTQRFRKRAANATLKLVITEAFVEAYDYNGTESLSAHCPWVADWTTGARAAVRCFDRLYGFANMSAILERRETTTDAQGNQIEHDLVLWQRYDGSVMLQGWAGNWKWRSLTYEDRRISTPEPNAKAIFKDSDFDLELVSGSAVGGGNVGAIVKLRRPVVVNIDLSPIPLDAEFTLHLDATAMADNRRGRESYIRARLRDPVSTGGTVIEATGLEPLETTKPWQPPSALNLPPPACSADATAPEAGIVQFSEHEFFEPEFGEPAPTITLTRTGGSRGTLVVTVRSENGGTANPGVDYTPIEKVLTFQDGQETPIAVPLALFDNEVPEGDRTINLSLSAAPGCANLGSRTSAVLTIVDDDSRAPVSTYSVGGTISGLQGTGLIIEEIRTGSRITPANGPFAFSYPYSDGDTYDVRVITQPTQPTQTCAVTRGTGTIAGASVSDIAIACQTAGSSAGLDPSFGDGGRVSAGVTGEGRALALQADGKILVVGRRDLARFNPDGTLDSTFGTGGVVSTAFNGVSGEEARDLAVQPDGRILVVGFTRAAANTTNYDFVVARYNSNGTLDTSFGDGGKTTIDFYGRTDQAHRILLQDDGRIVVGGHAGFLSTEPNSIPENLFALARLTPDGVLDTTFGVEPPFIGTGKITMMGGASLAYALASGPDGKVVLGGRTGSDGAANPASALARFNSYGVPDSDSDADPDVYFGVDASSYGSAFLGNGDTVRDLHIDADGTIRGVVTTLFGGRYSFNVITFLVPFGSQAGRPSPFLLSDEVDLGPGDDIVTALARQPDGRFVVVGSASSTATVSDFGIVRFNADGSADSTFGTDGALTVDFFGAADGANDVIVQPDGKILVTGSARNGSSVGFGLVRILP